MTTLRQSIIKYCERIGKNPLLVQGAGGNVSWKEQKTLWIKASGTRLSEAKQKDIFLPVNFEEMSRAIKNGEYDITPCVMNSSLMKPSIETILHALVPTKIVVHLHAVEILSFLVRKDCDKSLASLLGDFVSYAMVDYHKPGVSLAIAVHSALNLNPSANVIFLKNHGVVLGGESIEEIEELLEIINALIGKCRYKKKISKKVIDEIEGYIALDDDEVQQLAINTHLFSKMKSNWALYPDHVVFLGDEPNLFSSMNSFYQFIKESTNSPDLIFIRGVGVFCTPSFNNDKKEQLRCYFDVLVRQERESSLNVLSKSNVSELLDWEAEKYRLHLSCDK